MWVCNELNIQQGMQLCGYALSRLHSRAMWVCIEQTTQQGMQLCGYALSRIHSRGCSYVGMH